MAVPVIREVQLHVTILNILDISVRGVCKTEDAEMTNVVIIHWDKKVQVGKDQEKAQSEKDSHSKNRGGEKTK